MRLVSSWAAVILLLSPVIVCAQDMSVAGNTFVFSLSTIAEQSRTVSSVVASSVELHLEREGIRVVSAEIRAPGDALAPELQALAEELNSPWVLQATLQQDQQQLSVALRLFDVRDQALVAAVQSTEPVGLTLDRAIAELTGDLLDAAREELSLASPDSRDQEPVTRRPAPPDPVSVDPPVQRPEPTRGVPLADSTLAVGLTYAPFVPVAASSNYMNVSLTGISAVVALLPFQTDAVAIGLGMNGLLAEATGVAATVAVQAASLSLLVRLAGTSVPFSPFLTLRGGASVILAENESLGSFFGIAPYGGAAIGADLLLTDGLFAQLAVSFDLIFERSIWIMGFSPGVGLELRI